ncbi:MAG: hypothetical protein ABSG17_15900 [Spirochaetia bacterium]|jgi:hypothetical protein
MAYIGRRMVELEKRISGDWFELREKAGDFHALLDVLALTPAELRNAATRLRLSVEQGIIEFKRSMLSPVLVALETARYKSLDGEEMTEQERTLSSLLFSVLVQRLVAADLLPRSRPREEGAGVSTDELEVGTIVAAVKAKIDTNPDLRAHPAIKNILAQVQIYNKENRKMRELLPMIKPEMRSSFLANFSRTFGDIVGSIRRHYAVLLQEEAAASKSRKPEFSLALLPLKDLAPLLSTQAREIARMRSTLAHAREEKYKTREVLVRLYDSRHQVLGFIEDEVKMYRKICRETLQYDLDACAQEITVGFRDQIAAILEKQSRREEPA